MRSNDSGCANIACYDWCGADNRRRGGRLAFGSTGRGQTLGVRVASRKQLTSGRGNQRTG